jgi:hypothetical protein
VKSAFQPKPKIFCIEKSNIIVLPSLQHELENCNNIEVIEENKEKVFNVEKVSLTSAVLSSLTSVDFEKDIDTIHHEKGIGVQKFIDNDTYKNISIHKDNLNVKTSEASQSSPLTITTQIYSDSIVSDKTSSNTHVKLELLNDEQHKNKEEQQTTKKSIKKHCLAQWQTTLPGKCVTANRTFVIYFIFLVLMLIV